jgi:hypothetical protein
MRSGPPPRPGMDSEEGIALFASTSPTCANSICSSQLSRTATGPVEARQAVRARWERQVSFTTHSTLLA